MVKEFNYAKENLEEIGEDEISIGERIRDIIVRNLKQGGSRPDGWIFIKKSEKLHIVVAIETKLYDLDPYQLNNHLKKSLGNSEKIIYIKFEDVFKFLDEMNEDKNRVIVDHFLDYMEKLGYYTKEEIISKKDFKYLLNAKDSSMIRRKFRKFVKEYFNPKNGKYLEIKDKYALNYKPSKGEVYLYTVDNRIGDLGNIYFDMEDLVNKEKIESNMPLFFMGTELGVKCQWWNERIEKGKEEVEAAFIEKYKNNNENGIKSKYEVFMRVNTCQRTNYYWLSNEEEVLSALKLKSDRGIKRGQSKEECMEVLKSDIISQLELDEKISNEELKTKDIKSGVLENWKMVERWKYGEDGSKSKYHLMPYLRFVDYFPLSLIMEKNQDEFNEIFHKYLLKHIEGLEAIHSAIINEGNKIN